jgi:hypothetical protein
MHFVETSDLLVIEHLSGWHGRYFHPPSMTFGHYEFQGRGLDPRALDSVPSVNRLVSRVIGNGTCSRIAVHELFCKFGSTRM